MAHTCRDLLDEIKRKHGLRSDYALAKHLEVRVQLISNYRNRRSFPDEVMACRLADELGLPRGYVLACVAAERADRAEKDDLADTWRALAKKMGVTVALVLIGVSLHNPFHGAIAGVAGPIYTYAANWARRLTRWALQALSRGVR